MKLSPKQRELLSKKFAEFPKSICPICKTGNIFLNDKLFELREFEGGNLIIGGGSSLVPLIIATCQNCGHTQFFNAITLGIVSNESNLDGNDTKK